MGQGLSAKQEAFAVAVASGENLTAAYRRAGYKASNPKTSNEEACRLAKAPKVATRIAELRAPAVKKAAVTLEGHIADLERLRDAAEAAGQYSAAIKAEESRGKVAGLYVEKHEHSGRDGGPLTVATVRRIIVDGAES